MPEGNPLVADAKKDPDGPGAFTAGNGDYGWAGGIGIAESSMDAFNGIKDGDWVSEALGEEASSHAIRDRLHRDFREAFPGEDFDLRPHREVTPDLFGAAMDGTDPDQARLTPPGVMLQLIYPPIRMFSYLLRRDEAQFDTALTDAVQQYRTFWSAGDNAGSPDGFIALAPLAIAALARSVGMSVDVESEYLPRNFVHGIRPAGA